jgi:hypothetical protein
MGKASLARLCLLTVVVVLLVVPTATADVTIEQKGKMNGMAGLIAADIETKTMIKGDMQCVDSKVEMKGGLFGGMMGGEPLETSTITRLDKELVWEIQHPDKKYTEMTLAEKRQQMEEGESEGGPWGQMGPQGDDEKGKIKWSDPKWTVEQTGETDKIAGHDCEQSIVTMEMEGEDTETGDTVTMVLTMDLFLAKDIPGLSEYEAFGHKYAEAMGMEDWTQTDMAAGMLAAMTQYGINEEQLAEETEKLEGYPLRMKMKLNGEGSSFAGMGGGGMTAEDQKNLDEAKKALKSFGGLFGGGDDKEADSEDAEMSDSDALMEVELEVQNISTKSISDDHFTPPAKYKKQGD